VKLQEVTWNKRQEAPGKMPGSDPVKLQEVAR